MTLVRSSRAIRALLSRPFQFAAVKPLKSAITNRAASLMRSAKPYITVNLVALMVAIIGLYVTYREYQQHQKDLKIERSLEYLKNFTSSTWLDRRGIIDTAFDGLRPKLEELSRSKKTPNQIELEWRGAVITTITSDLNLRQAVDSLIEFYDGLLTCLELQLCDKMTLDSFFTTPAKIFVRQMYPYLYHIRREWGDDSLGTKLEEYARASVAPRE